MNRINAQGMEIIQYKTELGKDYPKIIKDSLILSLEQMMNNKVLDMDTYMNVKDDTLSVVKFRDYLLTKPSFRKTDEEIFKEFEVLRNVFDVKLMEHGVQNLKSESIIEKDIIELSRKFSINETFTMAYFGVEEKHLLKLMKRRGFIEKFAVLRLTHILQEFVGTVKYPSDLFKTDQSLVYFDPSDPSDEEKKEDGYSIDLCFEVKIEDVEKQERLDEICEGIKQVAKEAEEFYNSKTVF